MKNIILFCVFTQSIVAFSQLNINGGNDTTICVTWNIPGSLILGGNPTISGGTDPYTYTWECNYNYVVGPNTYLLTASDFLDDTTVSNPNLIYTVDSPVTFFLKVQDYSGQQAFDTIVVSFSSFHTHLLEYNHSMLVGDSVQFVSTPNLSGGIAPLSYLWRPNHGLIDSTSYTNFWVKPTANTSYYLTITDAVGCVVSGSPVFHVFVEYVNLSELKDDVTTLYPNPTNGQLFLKCDIENLKNVSIYDLNGTLLNEYSTEQLNEIDFTKYPKGDYSLILDFGDFKFTKQIIKI